MGLAAFIARRRRGKGQAAQAAFESTSFSLTTAVPRPAERRQDERRQDDRILPILRIAKLTADSGEQLIRVRNLSAGGLMADIGSALEVGEKVAVELSAQRIPGSVAWTRDGAIGVRFDENIDLGELLAGRKPRHGFRQRPPRMEVSCKASVKLGPTYHMVEVHDISLGGLKVEPISEYCVGRAVVVMIDSLRPVRGVVRWYSERNAGIVFDRPLEFEELAEWVGKRIEMAALKASYRE